MENYRWIVSLLISNEIIELVDTAADIPGKRDIDFAKKVIDAAGVQANMHQIIYRYQTDQIILSPMDPDTLKPAYIGPAVTFDVSELLGLNAQD